MSLTNESAAVKRYIGLRVALLCALSVPPVVSRAQGCGVVTPTPDLGAAVEVRGADVLRPAAKPLQQGFNLEWNTFQTEFWDTRKSALEPALIDFMSAFPGALYRFPGGTVSNYLDLAASIGPAPRRTSQRSVDWAGPQPMLFGLSEYYDFLAAVKGQPWLVLNAFGRFEGPRSTSELSSSWNEIAEFASGARAPVRFEIGNEPYLPRYGLSGAEYADRAKAVIDALGSKIDVGRFVVAGADIDSPRQRKSEFNRDLATGVGTRVREIAQHNYYDGPPWGPSVTNRLTALCTTLRQAVRDGVREPSIWVTEHARWPGGTPADRNWSALWPKTNNLEAGLGVADYVIALSQMEGVRGSFVHALSGTKSPWALFLRGRDGTLVPTALYRVLALLPALSSAGDVRAVMVKSPRESGYAGGYDLRASLLRDPKSGDWTLFAVNRSSKSLPTRLVIPELAGTTRTAVHRFVSAPDVNANNTPDRADLVVANEKRPVLAMDPGGVGRIELPPHSVNVLRLPARQN